MELNELLIALSSLKGVGAKTLKALTQNDLQSLKDENELLTLLHQVNISRFNPDNYSLAMLSQARRKAVKILENSLAKGIICINKKDPRYPKNFLAMEDAPEYFFAKGNVDCLKMPSVAVIGTREISPFGAKVGRRLGTVLAEKGIVVVSGLAIGCDAAGHHGCVDAGKPTVAILANGLDSVYPEENTQLAEDIIRNGGCLISEYPIGTRVNRYNLVARDRLQACMADGLIVVETGVKGGTLHAFRRAIKEKKPVACYAYSNQHYAKYPHSLGNAEFIKSNLAMAIKDKRSFEQFLAIVQERTEKEEDHDEPQYVQTSLFGE